MILKITKLPNYVLILGIISILFIPIFVFFFYFFTFIFGFLMVPVVGFLGERIFLFTFISPFTGIFAIILAIIYFVKSEKKLIGILKSAVGIGLAILNIIYFVTVYFKYLK